MPESDRRYAVGALVVVVLALIRVALTYGTFTQTYDEPNHVACGMAWLEGGDYGSCLDHPPLARIAVALGPYLEGIHPPPAAFDDDAGNPILYWGGHYVRNLTLARMGTLPFLVLACVVVFLWARRWFSAAAGFWAVLLFVNLPPILGHAGLATLDVACAATVLAALYQWMRWLETPGWRRAIACALTVSLALLSKLSSFAFLPVCVAGSLIGLALFDPSAVLQRTRLGSRILQGSVAVAIALVCVWGGYRFDLRPISNHRGAHVLVEHAFPASPLLVNVAARALELPVPLTDAGRGLWDLYVYNRQGDANYLFGSTRPQGWWAFFPVAVGVKTPIGFLLLAAAGLVVALAPWWKSPWQHRLTAFFPCAILLVCMASRINLGLRHALSMFPFLAILAGQLVVLALTSRRRLAALGAVLLVSWIAIDSAGAHPDYLAYLNPLAGAQPERILVESDLDWGQDLSRLSQRLKVLNIKEISIAYFGTARLESAGLPHYVVLGPHDTATGYVAASVRSFTLEYALDGSYGWLRQLTPVERIGKSIDLFHVDGPRAAVLASGGDR